MIRWFRERLTFNQDIAQANTLLTQNLNMAQAEIETLKQWNQELRERASRFEEMILRRAGLMVSAGDANNVGQIERPMPIVETWRTAKRKLENMHKSAESTTDKLSEEQQQYWEEKMKKQEEVAQNS